MTMSSDRPAPNSSAIKLWHEHLRAALQDTPSTYGMTVAQLATIRPPTTTPPSIAARPTIRSVNIRHYDETALYFLTDTRSEKAQTIHHNHPHPTPAELHFWMPAARLQLRLSGALERHLDESLRLHWWQELPLSQRVWFAWPAPTATRDDHALAAAQPSNSAPENFVVLRVVPDFVDVLFLTDMPYKREHHTATQLSTGDKAWQVKLVNP